MALINASTRTSATANQRIHVDDSREEATAASSAAPLGGSSSGTVSGATLKAVALSHQQLAGKLDVPALDHDLKQEFTAKAQDAEQFHDLFKSVFGADVDTAAVESLRQDALAGDYDWLPEVKWVSAEEMPQGYGAYHLESNTIYMNEEFRGTRVARQTFVEEVGHALDAQLNTSDTRGDEGEHFKLALAGESISAERLTAIRNEDDSGQIVVNGETLTVEFGLGSWIKKNIIKPVKEHVIDPIKDNVIDPINDNIIKPLITTGKEALSDGWSMVKNVISSPFRWVKDGVSGLVDTAGHLVRGDWSEAWGSFRDTVKGAVLAPVKLGVSTFMQGLHMSVNVIDNLTGRVDERGLSAAEINYLKPIFGDSLDYSAIRIQSGGLKGDVGMRANTVGNDVWLTPTTGGKSTFNSDGSLSEAGLELLGHEVGHVWQYQTGGADYIPEALYAQVFGDGYDWRGALEGGKSFQEMNPEQQASVAELIGMTMVQPAGAETGLTFDRFNDMLEANGEASITMTQFQIILDSHQVILNG